MSKDLEDLADRGEAALAHFGVKGMKWGVRNSPESLAAKRATLQEKKVGASSRTTAALTKQTKAQTKTIGKLSKGKDISYLQRRRMKKAGKEAVRALRSEKKLNRKIKRLDTKISRMDKKWTERGKNAVHEILDGAAIAMATING